MRHVLKLSGRRVTGIYSDALNLQALGSPLVARASEVEYDNDRGGWTVRFADGTFLCYHGVGVGCPTRVFKTRADALAAEVAELEARLRSATPPRVTVVDGKATVVFDAAAAS